MITQIRNHVLDRQLLGLVVVLTAVLLVGSFSIAPVLEAGSGKFVLNENYEGGDGDPEEFGAPTLVMWVIRAFTFSRFFLSPGPFAWRVFR